MGIVGENPSPEQQGKRGISSEGRASFAYVGNHMAFYQLLL